MNANLQQLLSTVMTRREFLTYLGILLLSVTGISGLMKTITNINFLSSRGAEKEVVKAEKGYGAGAYGI